MTAAEGIGHLRGIAGDIGMTTSDSGKKSSSGLAALPC
jgi:hypothetical protein